MKQIPRSHLELIDGPYIVALTTIIPDGQLQTTPVWCNRKGDYIFINVMKGFRKEKNMRLNPKVSLLAFEPAFVGRHSNSMSFLSWSLLA